MKNILFLFLFCNVIIANTQKNVEFIEENFPESISALHKAQSNIEKGDEYFLFGPQEFTNALKYYLRANEFNPNNALLNFQIATIQKQFNYREEAAKFYEKAIILDNEFRNKALLPLAEELHLNGHWDKAIETYIEYKSLLNSPESNNVSLENATLEAEKEYIEMRIKQANNGKKNVRDSISIIMHNMGPNINSKYPDYTAVVNENEDLIVFTSRRDGSTGGMTDSESPFQFEDIYYSKKKEDGIWVPAKKLKGDVNTDNHDAAVWLSPKGDKLIIYTFEGNGDLYESEFVDGYWTRPTPMKMINSSKYRETHACYSPDGNTIYFTTNNPKYATMGGLDICKVFKDDNGKWGEPEEIEVINTIYNEESPFIKSDGKTFYFSSQGHTSIGGYDIFKCEILDGHFRKPQNIGFPLNSTSNDIFIFFSENGKKAYLDSDRKGGNGEKDIYEMYILDAIKLPLIVEIYDERTNLLIQADLSVIEKAYIPIEVNLKNDSIGKYSSFIGVSKYYTADARAIGYESKNIIFNTKFDSLPNFDTLIIRQKVYLKPTFAPIVMKCNLKDKKTLETVNGEVEITAAELLIAKLNTIDGKCQYNLDIDINYEVIVIAKGYKIVKEKVRFKKDDLSKTIYLANLELELLEIGDKFILKNVYFDYDRSNLRSESVNELNVLKEFLINNPSVRVEVSAHTDSRGGSPYNYALSNSRATSVLEWLISNGINQNRLTSKGYGFDQPIAPNDTEENMQMNRRVEFKIIK